MKSTFCSGFGRFLVIVAVLLSFSATSSAAATRWLDGSSKRHQGMCSDLYGTYNMNLTMEYTGYYGADDGSYPKTGDVYYAHVVVGNTAGFPCMASQLMSLELVLPPNTVTAIDQAHPIRCFMTKLSTGVTTERTNIQDSTYFCPTAATPGTYGTNLGWVNLISGYMWEVRVPLVSTKQLVGSGSTTDKLTAGVTMQAGNGSGLTAPEAFVFVAGSTPTIGYPSPSAVNVTDTDARTLAYLYNNYAAGQIYFEIGDFPPTGIDPYPFKGPNYPIDGQQNFYSLYQDWSGGTPNTLSHWRMCFVTAANVTYCGAEQFVTSLASPPAGPRYTLSLSSTSGGSTSAGGEYPAGTSVSVTATPIAGYVFSGWNLDQSTTPITDNPYQIVMNASHALRANFSPSTTTTGGANLDLTMTAGSASVAVGSAVTYSLTVANNGPDPALAVVLKDTLPAGTTFMSATPASGNCSQAAGVVTCNLGGISNGASSSVTIVVTTTAAGQIVNQADVSSSSQDNIPINNSASITVNVAAVTDADLALTMSASPGSAVAGNNLTYTLTVQNNGPAAATAVVLTDTLPSGATFVSATPGTPTCSLSGGTVTCNLGTLVNGASSSATIVVTPTAAGSLNNQANVSSATQDPVTANSSVSVSTTVAAAINEADLAVTMTSSPQLASVGTNLSYAVTVKNNGPAAATAVVLTDTLPSGVTFVSTSPGNPTCAQSAGVVTCNLGTLAHGDSSSAAIVVTPQSAGTINNQASVASGTPDPSSGNNAASLGASVAATASMTVASGSGAPAADISAQKGETNIETAQFVISAAPGAQDMRLSKVVLQASGTGNDALDIAAVKLYLDANGNGSVDQGEMLLASGAFTGDNGSLELNLITALTVTAGASRTLLVSYDLNVTLAALPFAGVTLAFAGMIAQRRTRRWLLLAAIGVAAIWFNACGGGGGGGGTGASQNRTYHVTIADVTVQDAATGNALAAAGLPIEGSTVTVSK